MKIVKLTAENFKRLHAVEITPDGAVVIINGQNGAGKSSVLDSIEAALGGGRSIPGVPIHEGERRARVVLETEELTVTRKFTAKGSSIEVVARDGTAYKSPQTMLDRLVGTLSFDPLDFSRQGAKEQLDVLRGIVGLNFIQHDIDRGVVFDQRREVNRDIKRVRAHLEKLPRHRDAPESEVIIADLLVQLGDRRESNQNIKDCLADLGEELARNEGMRSEAGELRSRLGELESRIAASDKDLAELTDHARANKAESTSDLEEQIAGAEEKNRKLAQNRDHEQVTAELEDLETGAETLTDEIEAFDEKKAATIRDAEFPVDGLGFDQDGVTLNGLPYAQASGAEQLKASVGIGMSLNPSLRVLLIRDGSLLDQGNLEGLQEMAKAADFQCWGERVSDDGAAGILIEDGRVSDGQP